MQSLLTREIEQAKYCANCSMYGQTTAGCYNREPAIMIEDVNFAGAYGSQKI